MPGPPSLVISPYPGKTSMAHQFVEGKFVECYEPTVESRQVHHPAALLHHQHPQLGPGPLSNIPAEVTMGIFMKLIEEINQMENSYGRSSCCLM
ncbi:GTPase RhebL1 [Sylvia atricapilla]|uniref:GTPase RhebL1 n=1 Tax=Sylvia atricapilla TaxID=48155 RepID=UPI003395BEEF